MKKALVPLVALGLLAGAGGARADHEDGPAFLFPWLQTDPPPEKHRGKAAAPRQASRDSQRAQQGSAHPTGETFPYD